MHPVALIPLASALLAAALAAASAARDPGHRANRLMAAVLCLNAWWALCQVLGLTAQDAATALFYTRLETLGCVMLAPVSLHLLVAVLPEPFLPDRRLLAAQYALAAGLALASWLGPGYVPEVVRTDFGWAPAIGPLVPWIYVGLLTLPAVAALRLVKRSTLQSLSRPHAIPWIEFAIGLTVLVTAITDFALPAMGRFVPRLGSASVSLWALFTWYAAYRFRGAGLSPRAFANEILATLPDGVALVRLDGRIRAANAKLAQLARQPHQNLIGRRLAELVVEPQAAVTGAERECELVSSSGARVPVSLSDAWLRDVDGAAIGRVLVIRDLEELVSLRSRLLTSARLAAVGQLAAGIAHEINNPIAYVRSNVGLLERHWKTLADELSARESAAAALPALARAQELLRTAADGIDRVASIVRDVGGFSWKGGAENELTNPIELLELAVRVAGPQLRRKAEVERRFAKLPLVPCRPQELMQVFLNLVLAALQAIDQRGRLRLSAGPGEGAESGFVWIEIEVAGDHLAPELLDPVFDPFETPGGGTEQSGLGLAISRQMVERQGGSIRVSSQAGRSVHFRVSLPIAPAANEAAA